MPGMFDPSTYEPVQSRIAKFWADHPNGRVTTDQRGAPDGEVIFVAFLYRDQETEPFSSGWAHEVVGQGNVNRTSALENCETSAIGRALANAGYAPSVRPSREEMAKVEREDSRRGSTKAAVKERAVTPAAPPSEPSPVEAAKGVIIPEIQETLKERLITLINAGIKANESWKAAGLPALDHLTEDLLPVAEQLLADLEAELEEPF